MNLSEHLWLLMVTAGLCVVTILTRSFFLLVPERYELPNWAQRALRYAPVIALSAVIAPDFMRHNQHIDLSWHNPAWLAAWLTGLVYVASKRLLTSIALGMVVYTLGRLYL